MVDKHKGLLAPPLDSKRKAELMESARATGVLPLDAMAPTAESVLRQVRRAWHKANIEQRRARWLAVRANIDYGLPLREIAKAVGMSHQAIHKMTAGVEPGQADRVLKAIDREERRLR